MSSLQLFHCTCKVNSVQEACTKCFAVHISKFEILAISQKRKLINYVVGRNLLCLDHAFSMSWYIDPKEQENLLRVEIVDETGNQKEPFNEFQNKLGAETAFYEKNIVERSQINNGKTAYYNENNISVRRDTKFFWKSKGGGQRLS